ncbi:MAG: WD40/YVTN/BNR-like repeat-containing protein, partial [bacterium]
MSYTSKEPNFIANNKPQKMKKIILLTFAFCASLLLAINTSITPNDGNKEIKPLQSERELDSNQDEPLQFFKFHEGIMNATNESSQSYSAGYKLDEFRQAYQLSLQKSKNSNIARTQGANGVLEFKERGPGNVPGRTRALLVLPSDASKNTCLAGAATGGIWKTTNGGSTWAEKSANFPVLPISSLAMSSSNNNIIYAGTGELISSIYSAIGDGIFKSLDEGETWTQLPATAGNGDFSIVTRIIVDPQDPNILLASCSRSSLGTDTRSS